MLATAAAVWTCAAQPQQVARSTPAVQYPTTAQLQQAMRQLDWMIGRWEGSGWVESATAGRQEFSYSATVRPEQGGLLLVIDGLGHADADRPIVYARQVLISGPPPAVLPGPPGTYFWQESGSAGPYLRGNEAQGTSRSLQVGLPLLRADCDWIVAATRRDWCRNGGEGAWSRATITLNDEGEWIETREWRTNSSTDRSWHTYFRAALRRVEQDRRSIALEGGLALHLQPIVANRGTPQVYVEQGLQTIAALGRQQVLMSRPFGMLGRSQAIYYSLIAFADKTGSSDVSIRGQVLVGEQAWEYQTSARQENWEESIAVVLEALSQLPHGSRSP